MLTTEQAFQLLELQPSATWDEVRQTYRELVKVWHPDRFQDDEKFKVRATRKVQDINDAYRVLEVHYQKPPAPPPPIPKPDKAEEMFERWAADSKIQSQQQTVKEGKDIPNLPSLHALMLLFSFAQPYRVYPCHIRRSDDYLSPASLARIFFYTSFLFVAGSIWWDWLSLLFGLCMLLAGVMKLADWAGWKFNLPDALLFTADAVVMIEGVKRVSGQEFTATTCHYYPYTHLHHLHEDGTAFSFQTKTGIKFTFTPTNEADLIKPDTRAYNEFVLAPAEAYVFLQNSPCQSAG